MNYLSAFSLLCVLLILVSVTFSDKIEKRYKWSLLIYLTSVFAWILGLVYSRFFFPTEVLIVPHSLLYYISLTTFIAAVFAFYFQYFFASTYGEKKINWSLLAKINFGIFLIFLTITATPGLILESFLIPADRSYADTGKGPLILAYVGYILYFYVSTLVVLINRIRKTENLVLKAQLKCLLFGAGVFLGLAITTNLILSSVFNNPQLNSLGPAFYMIEAAVYVYAVSRYRFLNLEHWWPFSDSTVNQINQVQRHFLESIKKGTLRLKQIFELNQVELVLAGDARFADFKHLADYAVTHEEVVRSELDYELMKAKNPDPVLRRVKAEMDNFMIVAMLPIKKEGQLIGLLLLEQEEDRIFSVQEMDGLKRVLNEATYLISRDQAYKETLSQLVAGNNETQKELFKDLMHEVRTPLMLARNMPELIDWGQLKPEDQAYLKQSQDSLQGLSVKLEKISEAFSFSQGTIPIQKTRATLSELVDFALSDLQELDPHIENRVEVTWETPQLSSQLFFFDMSLLKRFLFELVKNTLFFAEETPQIKCHFKMESSRVYISYEDNACGIPSTEWDRVFDLMYVVAESRNEKESGLGLGLTIARGAIKAHDGEIIIKKSRPDKGTTFEIRLPLETA